MRIALCFMTAALLVQSCFGYIRNGFTDAGGFTAYTRVDAAGIQYFVNDRIKAGQVSTASGSPVTVISAASDPVAAIRAALAAWNAVPGSPVRFLPLKSTPAGNDANDFQMTVSFAANADELSLLNGSVAVTLSVHFAGSSKLPNGTPVDKSTIIDSDILLNPTMAFSTDGSTPVDVQAVITHELGHALGENHSHVFGATMFPYVAVGKVASLGQRLLGGDEQAFAIAVYGSSQASLGTIGGKVSGVDGSGIKAALVTLIDRTAGNTVSTIAGSDGTWSIKVIPGSYIVYAEPFNSIVAVANIYNVDPAQVTTGFQTTVLGGPALPTEIAVAAGANVTGANITVSPNTGLLTAPFQAFGAAGASGDVVNGLFQASGPAVISSGRSFDLALLAGGVDATTTVQIFGQGISVRAGSTHVDTRVVFSQGPLLRTTIDVAPRETPSLATLLIVKGTNVISYTGIYVLVPAQPTFSSKGIVNAASYVGQANGDGLVSPGGLYSIYDLPNAPNLGPAVYDVNHGYDAYGNLPSNLAGVTVTFDGIPAPLFLSFNSQLNLQVPFELAGKTTAMVQVSFNGSTSAAVPVTVAASQPAFFTVTPKGNDSIAQNQDFSLNSDRNPEARGRAVTIYGTGLGQIAYPVATGQGAPGPPAGYSGNSSCTFNGTVTAPVAFTGWTPQTVGLAQWTLVLPQNSPTGKVSVACFDTYGRSTPEGTLYIK